MQMPYSRESLVLWTHLLKGHSKGLKCKGYPNAGDLCLGSILTYDMPLFEEPWYLVLASKNMGRTVISLLSFVLVVISTRHAIVPMRFGHRVPIISDKISRGHDRNGYLVARKLGLPILNVMIKDGTLNEIAGLYR
ncbi:valine--tRNA ligase [Sarracenia purpurea var. burkii]